MAPAVPLPSDSTDLCTSCGLCCSGVVYDWYRVARPRSRMWLIWACGLMKIPPVSRGLTCLADTCREHGAAFTGDGQALAPSFNASS